jgi:hypothetical protein
MEPLSATPLGASPETSKFSVSPAAASSSGMTGLKSRFQSSALEEAKQQGFTWMPPRKQLYFTLERVTIPRFSLPHLYFLFILLRSDRLLSNKSFFVLFVAL